ncbi:hypothetical protein CCS92_32575, partial [Methylobacterium radiotolerans]
MLISAAAPAEMSPALNSLARHAALPTSLGEADALRQARDEAGEADLVDDLGALAGPRSDEPTSELQS